MSAIRSLVPRLPVRVLLGWLLASMIAWLGVAIAGLAIEHEVYAVHLTGTQIVAVIAGMEGVALVLALTIFAIFALVARADDPERGARKPQRAVAWHTPLSTGGHPIVASVLPRWRATVLQ